MSVKRVRKECFATQIGVDGELMDYPYATCCGLNDEVAHAFRVITNLKKVIY